MARTYFENLPSTNTPLRAERFNGLLNGEESIEKIVAGSIEGKNLFEAFIQSGTYDSVTYTVSSNGLITQSASDGSSWSITQNRVFYLDAGTYTISINVISGAKDYIQLRNITDDTDLVKTSGNTRTFTIDSRKAVAFKTYGSGGTYPVSYYLQIEKGTEATDYVPFMKYGYNSVDTMGDIVVDNISCKNLLDFTQFEASKTLNGITFTNNGDGTITANGTATANTDFKLLGSYTDQKNIIGNYITGGINSSVTVRAVNKTDSTYTILGTSSGSPSTINKSFGTGYIEIRVANGTTVNNQIIKPMMTYAEDNIYVPYKSFDATAYVLWTNSSRTSDFASQTITLSDSLDNYKYYEINYMESKYENYSLNTGKIPTAFSTKIITTLNANNTGVVNRFRSVTRASATTLTIADCLSIVGQTTSQTTNNDRVIPYQVIAYK